MRPRAGVVVASGVALLAVVALLISLLWVSSPVTAVGTTVEVATGAAPVVLAPGQSAVLNVTVKDIADVDGLGAYDFIVAFDPAVIQVQQVLGGTAPFDTVQASSIDNNAGTVTLVSFQASQSPGPLGDIVVAKLQVQAVGGNGATTTVDLTINPNGLLDTNTDEIPATDTDGTVNVVSSVVVSIESGQVVAGGTTLLDVTIKNVEDVDGLGDYSVRVNFTPGAIQVLDVQGGAAPFDAAPTFLVGAGTVSFTSLQSSAVPGPTGNIVVARIQVQAVAGTTALDVQPSDGVLLDAHDTNGDSLGYTDEDGTFKTLTPAQVTVASVNAGPGDAATVPITVSMLGDYPAGLKAYDVTVAFDKNVLTVADVLGGDAPFDAAPTKTINNVAGTVQISRSQTDLPVTADTVVARLQVTAALTGTSALNLTVNSLTDMQDNPIPSADVDGTFTVVVGVQIESAAALAGSQVTLDVTVRNVTDPDGLGSYNLRMEFPAGTLTVTDVLGGDAPFDAAPSFLVGAGFVNFTGFQAIASPGPTGNVVVARIVVTAPAGAGVTPLNMVVTGGDPARGVQDTNGDDMVVVDQDGALTTFTNQLPVAVNDSYTTAEDTALNVVAPGVLANDTDPDGDPLTALKVTDPGHGAVVVNANGSFTYTPAANYNGNDSFTYMANDGQSDSNVATVNITITPVNDAPTAVNDVYTTNELQTLTVAAPGVLANDTDPENDALTAIKVTDPVHGFLTLNANGSFTYTPVVFFSGNDSFTYRASDGTLTSNIATVTITVVPNPTPVPTATPVVTVIPPAQITPIPTFTPVPGQTPVPVASGVVNPSQSTTITQTAGNQVSAQFPAGTFTTTTQATVRDVPTSQIPALPPEIASVTKAFEISIYDANGNLIEHPALNRCITVTAPYTDADVAAAGGSPFSLRLMRYDSLTQVWIVLTTSVDVVKQELRAQVCGTLSVFGVGVTPQVVTPTPTTVPTPTIPPLKPRVGGAAPTSNLLLGLLAAGIILVLSGGYYLRRAKG